MSSWVRYVPEIMQAAGTKGGARDAKLNAQILREQSRNAGAQGARDEEAQRRAARQSLGRSAAAIAENGGGMTGSSAASLEQAAVMAELDALNVRYAGQSRARGLLAESLSERMRGKRMGMLAGGQLLAGVSGAYTRGKLVS